MNAQNPLLDAATQRMQSAANARRMPSRAAAWLKSAWNWKKAIAVVGIYYGLLGFVTFPLFIMEESVQVAQGGTWAAKAARDWESMRMGYDMVEEIAGDLHGVNLYFGWINPFSWRAYEHYARGAKYYAAACRKQADKGEK